MSVLVTMRVKVNDFAGVKAAMAKYAAGLPQSSSRLPANSAGWQSNRSGDDVPLCR